MCALSSQNDSSFKLFTYNDIFRFYLYFFIFLYSFKLFAPMLYRRCSSSALLNISCTIGMEAIHKLKTLNSIKTIWLMFVWNLQLSHTSEWHFVCIRLVFTVFCCCCFQTYQIQKCSQLAKWGKRRRRRRRDVYAK